MSSEFTDRQAFRIASMFGVLDVDGDGVITRADFELLAERVYALVSGHAGEAQRTAIQDAALGWWKQLSQDLDANSDGQITTREYVTDFKTGGVTRQEDYFDRGAGPLAAAIAQAADIDGDGFISEHEHIALIRAAFLNEEGDDTARAEFRRLDVDGTGKISIERFRSAVYQLFRTEDPAEA